MAAGLLACPCRGLSTSSPSVCYRSPYGTNAQVARAAARRRRAACTVHCDRIPGYATGGHGGYAGIGARAGGAAARPPVRLALHHTASLPPAAALAATRSAAHTTALLAGRAWQGRIALRSAALGGAGLRPIERYALHQILDVLYALPFFDVVCIRLLRAVDQRLVRYVPSVVQL